MHGAEKRKESKELAPKPAKKEVIAKDMRKADSQAFVQKLMWEIAELIGCGKMQKGKFRYDMGKKYAFSGL